MPGLPDIDQAKTSQQSTKRRMVEALRLILKAKPVSSIRAKEIAAAVGYSQPSFYKHFDNLEEALLAAAELSWKSYPQLESYIGPEMDLDVARHVAATIIDFWKNHGTTLSWTYFTEIGASMADYVAMREEGQIAFVRACNAQIRRAQRDGRIAPEIDAELSSYFVVSRLDNFGLAQSMIYSFSQYDKSDLIDTCARMLLNDLGLG